MTGVVDAMSFLHLGHVFVANMTRRIALVVSMFTGAAIAALLVVHASPGWVLGTAGALLATVAVASRRT